VLPMYVVNGITGVRDIGVRDTESRLEERAKVENNFPAPEIAIPGPTLHPDLVSNASLIPARTSTGFRAGHPELSLNEGLELLVKTGTTPLHALQTVTFNAALYMAKLDKFGVIELGHIADLVLLDENPLEDIRNTRKIAGVVLRGTYFSRFDLDGLLSHLERDSDSAFHAPESGDPRPVN